jgi:PAS domain S-box-containing protein/putative nucleotidyltransferase with HDIG domain
VSSGDVLRVLIVEDSVADAELMLLALEEYGMAVSGQRVQTEAEYRIALDAEPDVILSDWSLPGFSGLRALSLLHERDQDIPFIIVSGSIGEDAAVAALQQGADDYLLKDRIRRLGQAVVNALQKRQARRERLQAIETLAASEAELRALFAAMRDIVIVVDREGIYRKIAPTQPNLLVRPAAELLGKSLQDVFPPAQAQEYLTVVRQALQTGTTRRIEYALSIGGQTVWFDASLSPMSADCVIWVAHDISERRRHEQEQMRQQMRFQLLYEAGKEFSQSLDLLQIYMAFYRCAAGVMKCNGMCLTDLDPLTVRFAIAEGQLLDVSYFASVRLDAEEIGALVSVVRNGISQRISYVTHHQICPNMPGAHSAMMIPISFRNQITGMVWIQAEEEAAYGEEDQQFMELLAAQLAIAINNAQLYQQSRNEIEQRKQVEQALQVYSQRLERMTELGRSLASTLDLQAIYRIAEQYLHQLADCPNVAVSLLDGSQNLLRPAYINADGVLIDVRLLPALKYDPLQATSGRSLAIASQQPVIITNLVQKYYSGGVILIGDDRLPDSAIYLPMVVEGKSIGLLELQSYSANAYSEQDARWMQIVANQIGLAIQNARLFSLLQSRIAELAALHEIDTAVLAHRGQEETLEILLACVMAQLGADAADILLFDPKTHELKFVGGRGFWTLKAKQVCLKLGEGLAGQAFSDNDFLYRLDLNEVDDVLLQRQGWAQEEFRSYVGAPLVVEERVIGVLEVFQRTPLVPDENWMRFLETLAKQTAVVVEHIHLFERIQQVNQELLEAYDETIAGWSRALDLRDQETEGHSLRVTRLTELLAMEMGVNGEQLIHIRRGALLHDIGKLGVPDAILFKPGPLTPQEWLVMRQHPVFAYQMLQKIEYLRPALEIPYCHHEKWDGTGYPRQLSETNIPLSARIFALADIWDALRSDRPYRSAWPVEKTLTYILSLSGNHLDPAVVQAFQNIIKKDPSLIDHSS